ncbi:DNA repair protein XRCC2-like [Cydia pomonella]|uniref:DNA repair protein XRCC2-like n=1 Tax=Cydia pomonella TaxID=82600 RepID=UPI002ADE538B|nr:DNA repair protein XRCC2-like [Cydia pomonella]
MEKTKFKVESGIQLLTRLSTKKTIVDNFYPNLFQTSPKSGEVIEIFSNRSCSFLLIDMITEAVLPIKFGGAEIGVLILNTDGHISLQALTASLQNKLHTQYNFGLREDDCGKVLNDVIKNIFILDVFDATELYTTFQNLENILTKHNISLCVIDTLTAFYWSEQSFKITKMDIYLRNLLHIVQKAVQGHKVTMLYTRPEYFNSSKDLLENTEVCADVPTAKKVNFRIRIYQNEDETFTATVTTSSDVTRKNFKIEFNKISWL